MSDHTTVPLPDVYLPAVLEPSASPGRLERLLSRPFRRVREAWLPAA